jgi:hypothetical protein
VDEGDGLSLEIETVSLRAIEFIALDGTAEAVGMGAVHAELVGTAGMGPEGEEGEPPPAPPEEGSACGGVFRQALLPLGKVGRGQHSVLCDGAFAVLEVDDLSRTVHGIAEQGQVDDAVLLCWCTLYDGEVFFLHGVVRKLLL